MRAIVGQVIGLLMLLSCLMPSAVAWEVGDLVGFGLATRQAKRGYEPPRRFVELKAEDEGQQNSILVQCLFGMMGLVMLATILGPDPSTLLPPGEGSGMVILFLLAASSYVCAAVALFVGVANGWRSGWTEHVRAQNDGRL